VSGTPININYDKRTQDGNVKYSECVGSNPNVLELTRMCWN